jgi:hypothetical protein
MVVSINQPAYLPWLGYFERIACSDVHVVLDHVQFEKNSFTNRNKIRLREGTAWLSIPLATKGLFGKLEIHSLQFGPNSNWRAKHWASLKMNYSRAPYFEQFRGAYESIYAREWNSFMPFVRAMLTQHLSDLGIKTRLVFSSEMEAVGHKSDLVLNICKSLDAKSYLSGPQGRAYIDENAFLDAGIRIQYQDYQHPTYKQVWPGFESHLGILDLLFNHGEDSLQILIADQTPPQT